MENYMSWVAHRASLFYLWFQALIELLDEVEDVISVEESVCDKTEAWFDIGRAINEPDSIVEQQLINTKELVEKEPSNNYFLVLEVWNNILLFS